MVDLLNNSSSSKQLQKLRECSWESLRTSLTLKDWQAALRLGITANSSRLEKETARMKQLLLEFITTTQDISDKDLEKFVWTHSFSQISTSSQNSSFWKNYGLPNSQGQKKLGEILLAWGLINKQAQEKVLQIQLDSKKYFGEIAIEQNYATSQYIAQALAFQYRLTYIDLTEYQTLDSLPKKVAIQYSAIVVRDYSDYSVIAIANPHKLLVDDIRFILGREVKFVVATPEDIQKKIREHYPEDEGFDSFVDDLSDEDDYELEETDKSVEQDLLDDMKLGGSAGSLLDVFDGEDEIIGRESSPLDEPKLGERTQPLLDELFGDEDVGGEGFLAPDEFLDEPVEAFNKRGIEEEVLADVPEIEEVEAIVVEEEETDDELELDEGTLEEEQEQIDVGIESGTEKEDATATMALPTPSLEKDVDEPVETVTKEIEYVSRLKGEEKEFIREEDTEEEITKPVDRAGRLERFTRKFGSSYKTEKLFDLTPHVVDQLLETVSDSITSEICLEGKDEDCLILLREGSFLQELLVPEEIHQEIAKRLREATRFVDDTRKTVQITQSSLITTRQELLAVGQMCPKKKDQILLVRLFTNRALKDDALQQALHHTGETTPHFEKMLSDAAGEPGMLESLVSSSRKIMKACQRFFGLHCIYFIHLMDTVLGAITNYVQSIYQTWKTMRSLRKRLQHKNEYPTEELEKDLHDLEKYLSQVFSLPHPAEEMHTPTFAVEVVLKTRFHVDMMKRDLQFLTFREMKNTAKKTVWDFLVSFVPNPVDIYLTFKDVVVIGFLMHYRRFQVDRICQEAIRSYQGMIIAVNDDGEKEQDQAIEKVRKDLQRVQQILTKANKYVYPRYWKRYDLLWEFKRRGNIICDLEIEKWLRPVVEKSFYQKGFHLDSEELKSLHQEKKDFVLRYRLGEKLREQFLL